MEKPKMNWRGWTNVSTLPGAIIAAAAGGSIGTLFVEGFRYLIA
ncbi:hypothetical protein [Actinomadura hibisca]|nr:hypothetical protein [Actinomadura hibisca]